MHYSLTDSPLFKLPNTYHAFYGTFSGLHWIQRKTIQPILDGKDLVLQSATGSGKTEAVLAPCLEKVISSGRSCALIYIVPTRALAFDLKRRFDLFLTQRLGLGLAIRTGDMKRGGGNRPDLMITTPESLDVLLGSSNPDLKGFVSRIRMVIIDEVHPFVYQYRGQQLAYLLRRLQRRTGNTLQKIALSATIADMDAVIQFFDFKPDTFQLTESVNRKIIPHLIHLKNEDTEITTLLDDLYNVWKYRKILIFANSRSRCDGLFSMINGQGRFKGVCEIHYSNLKVNERRAAENRFRNNIHALCVTTSTLELGIDVGDVDAVLLYEPPDSVSPFLQRIGRSNRRQKNIHFWGICRGEKAGDQVLRFLGLLRLARKGIVESPLFRTLPSVLVQQILSCLYENRQISILALQGLFPEHRESIELLFDFMERKSWIKKAPFEGLFEGGRQYWNCLLERKIWSNFPETEEEYTLESEQEAIADIPKSVVRQLDIGDRVHLAGKPLQILKIDTGKEKRVSAIPATHLGDKEIYWLGTGLHVSYDVAQSMRELLKSSDKTENENAPGLFSRTRRLIHEELKKIENAVVLENGIEVVSGKPGLYRFRTFLGSVGNLILEWTIKKDMGKRFEDLYIISDEIGINCSLWIDFQKLSLPRNREDFYKWVKKNAGILNALFPLNSFCTALPESLLIEELTGFVYDSRVADAFDQYFKKSSKIVSGDRRSLEFQEQASAKEKKTFIRMPAFTESLLEREKKRWSTDQTLYAADANYISSQPLTGTIIGQYLRHKQCRRWFGFQFMPSDKQPPRRTRVDRLEMLRIERGRNYEKQVLSDLRAKSDALICIEENDANGSIIPVRKRFKESINRLRALIQKADQKPERLLYLSQSVFIVNSILKIPSVPLLQKDFQLSEINGIGIPDLIRVSKVKDKTFLEVGDIKSSFSPRYHQKWQVAFYAFLLKQIINSQKLSFRAELSSAGFLITRSPKEAAEIDCHTFDLHPYLSAFSILFQNLADILKYPASETEHKLDGHCATCSWFEYCYKETLQKQDIQFLPQLTLGELRKLRKLDINTIESAATWFEGSSLDSVNADCFSPYQRERIQDRLKSFKTNQVILRKKKTRLFPKNISTLIFLNGVTNPLSLLPVALGCHVLDDGGKVKDFRIWTINAKEDMARARQDFFSRLLKIWRQSVEQGKVPHIFCFGTGILESILKWGESSEYTTPLNFIWNNSHWTDLRQVIFEHFDLPIPGLLTLFSLSRLLGLSPEPNPPESLFHFDEFPDVFFNDKPKEKVKNEITAFLESSLMLQHNLWKWASSYLESEREQERLVFSDEIENPQRTGYLRFLKEEKRKREEDILLLQEYSLQERVERFRAIGPLNFQGVSLDQEGRFLYNFKISRETILSKFREGDFLKLVPLGISDLQSGFSVILTDYDRSLGKVSLLSRQKRLPLNKRISYSLEEDLTDWNEPKLTHIIQTIFSGDGSHMLSRLISGQWIHQQPPDSLLWIRNWLQQYEFIAKLNDTQKSALELPFRYGLSLIEGPPGTGKTHLLGWILLALIEQAQESGRPLRIAISALTHQAIDNVLNKVVQLVNVHKAGDFPGRCIKWGRQQTKKDEKIGGIQVESLDSAEEILKTPYLIIGATGYGFYQLFKSGNGKFPQFFDWVIFDEASQILVPQALLSLIYGKGNFVFLGDVKQLRPIVLGNYENDNRFSMMSNQGIDDQLECKVDLTTDLEKSVLEVLLDRYDSDHKICLDLTYRMNETLCMFPSCTWYDGMLKPSPEKTDNRLIVNNTLGHDLIDRILAPEKPVVLVLADHEGCHQESEIECEIITQLAFRLMNDCRLSADQLALISPHRAQNNAVTKRLGTLLENENINLPLIDTVERIQGAERDVIIFSFTSSDPDPIMTDFLNNPNRFNVAITRARNKLIVIGSNAFFSAISHTEKMLQKNSCFKEFWRYCKERESVFYW